MRGNTPFISRTAFGGRRLMDSEAIVVGLPVQRQATGARSGFERFAASSRKADGHELGINVLGLGGAVPYTARENKPTQVYRCDCCNARLRSSNPGNLCAPCEAR